MQLQRSTNVRSQSAAVYCLHSTFGMCCHQFADDTQLFIAMNAADTAPVPDRLTLCSDAVKQWFLQNDFQLNAGKSEVILLGTAVQLRSAADVTTIDIAGSPLPVALKLKSLGVIIDSHLCFDVHVSEVVKACKHHIRALCHVRHVLWMKQRR